MSSPIEKALVEWARMVQPELMAPEVEYLANIILEAAAQPASQERDEDALLERATERASCDPRHAEQHATETLVRIQRVLEQPKGSIGKRKILRECRGAIVALLARIRGGNEGVLNALINVSGRDLDHPDGPCWCPEGRGGADHTVACERARRLVARLRSGSEPGERRGWLHYESGEFESASMMPDHDPTECAQCVEVTFHGEVPSCGAMIDGGWWCGRYAGHPGNCAEDPTVPEPAARPSGGEGAPEPDDRAILKRLYGAAIGNAGVYPSSEWTECATKDYRYLFDHLPPEREAESDREAEIRADAERGVLERVTEECRLRAGEQTHGEAMDALGRFHQWLSRLSPNRSDEP